MNESQRPAEQFAPLKALPQIVHGFTLRVPGIEMSHDKAEALARLDGVHRKIRAEHGLANLPFITAEQVHGKEIAVVDAVVSESKCFENCDGLITNQRGVCLGIYVADCCAVFLVDPVRRAIGLVHSGKPRVLVPACPISLSSSAPVFARRITRSISRPPSSGNAAILESPPCTMGAFVLPAICRAIIPIVPRKAAPDGCWRF